MTSHQIKAQECAEEILKITHYKNISFYDLNPDNRAKSIAETLILHFPEPVEKVCRWTYYFLDTYEPSCLDSNRNSVKSDKLGDYCPYCGGKIV